MDAGLLVKLFGSDAQWKGRCTVILSADATVSTSGPDALASGGIKVYAPRLTSGRVEADAVCLLPEDRALLLIRQEEVRQQTGEEKMVQTLIVADIEHVVGVEFADLEALKGLNVPEPTIEARHEYRRGTLVG